MSKCPHTFVEQSRAIEHGDVWCPLCLRSQLAAERERREAAERERDNFVVAQIEAQDEESALRAHVVRERDTALAAQKAAEERAAGYERAERARVVAWLRGAPNAIRGAIAAGVPSIGPLYDAGLMAAMTQAADCIERGDHALAPQPADERRPAWCDVHQHYKWCEHNGGVLGRTGHEQPAAKEPKR